MSKIELRVRPGTTYYANKRFSITNVLVDQEEGPSYRRTLTFVPAPNKCIKFVYYPNNNINQAFFTNVLRIVDNTGKNYNIGSTLLRGRRDRSNPSKFEFYTANGMYELDMYNFLGTINNFIGDKTFRFVC